MTIEDLMNDIVIALPKHSKRLGIDTKREVCLTLYEDGWGVMAGGHPAVNLGEWGGDFSAYGDTAQEALIDCLHQIRYA